MLKSIIIAFMAGLAIPAIGVTAALGVFANINSNLPDGFDIRLVCADADIVGEIGIQTLCADVANLDLMYHVSMWSGFAIAALLSVYLMAALICGTNRSLLASVFRLLVPLSLITIAASVLVQGVVLVASIYYAEAYFFGQVHYILIGAIGIGAVIGAVTVLLSLIGIRTKAEANEAGISLEKSEDSQIWTRVIALASRIGAQPPENIVVGLSPTFYVTNADVNLINEATILTGETLFLSLPLMRLLNEEQLTAVIAHELGHFKGDDLKYSMKFAPVYRGLADTLNNVQDEDGGYSISTLPAAMILSAMYDIFSRNERKISRIREHDADRIAVQETSPEALGLGLAKCAVYADLWSDVRRKNVDRIGKGRIDRNLCTVFEDSSRYDIHQSALVDIVSDITSSTISHPTDTHPTI